jgi:hypothetical protein
MPTPPHRSWVGAKEQIARAMPILDTEGFKRQQLDARAGIPNC